MSMYLSMYLYVYVCIYVSTCMYVCMYLSMYLLACPSNQEQNDEIEGKSLFKILFNKSGIQAQLNLIIRTYMVLYYNTIIETLASTCSTIYKKKIYSSHLDEDQESFLL